MQRRQTMKMPKIRWEAASAAAVCPHDTAYLSNGIDITRIYRYGQDNYVCTEHIYGYRVGGNLQADTLEAAKQLAEYRIKQYFADIEEAEND
jgi:hypothetical protein